MSYQVIQVPGFGVQFLSQGPADGSFTGGASPSVQVNSIDTGLSVSAVFSQSTPLQPGDIGSMTVLNTATNSQQSYIAVYKGSVSVDGVQYPVIAAVTPPNFSTPAFTFVPGVTNTGTYAVSTSNFPCFLSGTRIATPKGHTAIEQLAPGDLVLTAAGPARPIRWIGHSTIDVASSLHPDEIRPIVVRADAFGLGHPVRDLYLSPRHCLAIDGHLIPVKALQNGATIEQIDMERVDYFHLELDSHDVVIAENIPAETYLDNGNRNAFENIHVRADHLAPMHWLDTCLPLVEAGPVVERVKADLLARAAVLGHERSQDPDLHLIADGRRIEPHRITETCLAFLPPADARHLNLCCRRFVPSHIDPASNDHRSLGVAINRLQIDGDDIPLWKNAAFTDGWYAVETDQPLPFRWTSGQAALPSGAKLIVVHVSGQGSYWRISEERNVIPLRRAVGP